MPPTRSAVADAAAELARRDPVLKGMVAAHGVPPLYRRRGGSDFAELVRMICFQQLAGRAATTIHGRVVALLGEVTPEAVLGTSDAALRDAGLSGAKTASVRDLAVKAAEGAIAFGRLSRLSDADVTAELVRVRGIGEWTAHMFLMFRLGRLDVWPTGDLGVRSGYARLYGHAPAPGARELGPLGEPFRPYRSLVAWYCWRAVDAGAPD